MQSSGQSIQLNQHSGISNNDDTPSEEPSNEEDRETQPSHYLRTTLLGVYCASPSCASHPLLNKRGPNLWIPTAHIIRGHWKCNKCYSGCAPNAEKACRDLRSQQLLLHSNLKDDNMSSAAQEVEKIFPSTSPRNHLYFCARCGSSSKEKRNMMKHYGKQNKHCISSIHLKCGPVLQGLHGFQCPSLILDQIKLGQFTLPYNHEQPIENNHTSSLPIMATAITTHDPNASVDVYEGKNSKENGKRTYTLFRDGQFYVIENKQGKKDGYGTSVWPSGESYVGEWKNGKRDGKGTFKWQDGSVYKGGWNDGKVHGNGTLNSADGRSYEGEWKDNRAHGRGIFIWPDGKRYIGEWKDDKRHGIGVMTYENQDTYDGEWKEGLRDGTGMMTFHNGDVYIGEFSNDNMHGRGVMTYANKDVYNGQWKDGQKNGKGTMTFHNKDVYVGEFSDDKMHGKGEYEYANTAETKRMKSIGEWKEGKKCGKFKEIYVKEVDYDNDEVKSDAKVKQEAGIYDEDTDTEDFPCNKRRKVSTTHS